MSSLDQTDYEFLRMNAVAARRLHAPQLTHLEHPIGIWNYIRIANAIARQVPAGRLLDWGCGYGQMTYLLQRRGFNVTPFDIRRSDLVLPDIPLCRDLPLVLTDEKLRLPFDDGSFDSVLSCGVLEHVDAHAGPRSEVQSLREIARILRPGGVFLIYQLPQRYAWQEALMRQLRLGYAHPRRYSVDEIRGMLYATGFQVQWVRRANLIPKNLTGMPERLRRLYSRFSLSLIALDGLLYRVPLLNELAGVMELHARRIPDSGSLPQDGPAAHEGSRTW